MELVRPINKYRNYFIHADGYVFKIENGTERRVSPWITKRTKRLVLKIENKEYELVYLMMEHFGIKFNQNDRLKFTKTKDMRVPLQSISVRKFYERWDLPLEEERLLYKYKCDTKAASANQRAGDQITPLQVYYSLKIHGFKCVYCGRNLTGDTWHLDHFQSLATTGKNVFENVVPACPTCNIMKGVLNGHQFFKMCKQIAKNYAFINDNLNTPIDQPINN